jgi:hypothetical protein
MKKQSILLIFAVLFISSCDKKNEPIEISKNELFIKGGIYDGLTIWKHVKDKTANLSPSPKYIEIVELNYVGTPTTYTDQNGEQFKYYNADAVKTLTERINFNTTDERHYWVLKKPSDTTRCSTLPITLENEHWYLINNFYINAAAYYYEFYIDESGEIINTKLSPALVSPI